MKKKENSQIKRFLRENPLKEISAAQFMYFHIVTWRLSELDEKMEKMVEPYMGAERREEYEREKEKIWEISSADEVINYMRKKIELQNRKPLLHKGLAMQEEVMPQVLKRLRTSAYDIFIENAVLLLALGDMKYVDELVQMFPEIRSPYARSMASLVLGLKKKRECTSLLLEQFEQIKREVPWETYEQGPLMALHLIYDEE